MYLSKNIPPRLASASDLVGQGLGDWWVLAVLVKDVLRLITDIMLTYASLAHSAPHARPSPRHQERQSDV